MVRKIKYSALLGLGFVLVFITVVALLSSNTRADTNKPVSKSGISAPDITDTSKWGSVFSDEFNGDTLNSSKWVTCYDWHLPDSSGCTNSGNNEQEWYESSHVSVANGVATLKATADPVTITQNGTTHTYPYQSGMISTGRLDTTGTVKWSGTYGYFEARMKVQGGQGVWPAFWLLPTNQKWPPEIDIMELLGNKTNQVLLTNHWSGTNGVPQENMSTITGSNFTTGWHTYAVNWQPESINWYVDGKLEKSVTGSNVPNTPMEIIIDLAIGGKLPGNTDSTTIFPRTVQIDYVRVYGKKL